MGDIYLTERELDVMAVLWELESATVPDVRERVADDLAYTTIQTVLRTLEAKGFVRHEEEGRFHRYYPRIAREEASQSALGRLLAKLCGGSPELLLTQLVAQRGIDEAQIRRMRDMLDGYLPEKEP